MQPKVDIVPKGCEFIHTQHLFTMETLPSEFKVLFSVFTISFLTNYLVQWSSVRLVYTYGYCITFYIDRNDWTLGTLDLANTPTPEQLHPSECTSCYIKRLSGIANAGIHQNTNTYTVSSSMMN